MEENRCDGTLKPSQGLFSFVKDFWAKAKELPLLDGILIGIESLANQILINTTRKDLLAIESDLQPCLESFDMMLSPSINSCYQAAESVVAHVASAFGRDELFYADRPPSMDGHLVEDAVASKIPTSSTDDTSYSSHESPRPKTVVVHKKSDNRLRRGRLSLLSAKRTSKSGRTSKKRDRNNQNDEDKSIYLDIQDG